MIFADQVSNRSALNADKLVSLAGIYVQITAYLDHTPADLIVAQDGVTNLLSATSLLPANTEDLARGVPGIGQLTPIISQFVIPNLYTIFIKPSS